MKKAVASGLDGAGDELAPGIDDEEIALPAPRPMQAPRVEQENGRWFRHGQAE